jgi:hypothetical protein
MKRTTLFLFALVYAIMTNAQVLKTIGCTSGNLSVLLTANEKTTVTDLTVTGSIDARDFKTMRDSMEVLANIDLSEATVEAYTGTHGTAGTGSIVYPADAIPSHGFGLLSGYNLKLNSISLPSTINDIGTSAFGYCKMLTSVTIPSTVSSIEGSAFCYCDLLSDVTLPSSLTSIGNFSFGNCTSLPSITIPTSVLSIYDIAFYGCNGLTNPEIVIPAAVTFIGTQAFAGCNGTITVNPANANYSSNAGVLFDKTQTSLLQCLTLKEGDYSMPSTVITIATYAFYNCQKIAGITIPSNVTSIGANTFLNCTGMQYINIPASVITIAPGAFDNQSGLISVNASNPNYYAENGILFNKDKTTVISCPVSITGDYIIPSTVTMIDYYAFGNCTLNSVTIPSSVTSIANYAFYYSMELRSISAKSATPINLISSDEVFFGADYANCTLYVPEGSKSKYDTANQWKDFNHIIEGNGLWLSDTIIDIAATEGSTATSDVHSNTSWTAISDQDWLAVDPNSETIGDATLTYTAAANPTTESRIATVTVSPTNLPSQSITITQAAGDVSNISTKIKDIVNFYPDPVKDKLYISDVQSVEYLAIFDAEGRLITNHTMNNTNCIDLSALARGVYIVRLTTHSRIFTAKIIKE